MKWKNRFAIRVTVAVLALAISLPATVLAARTPAPLVSNIKIENNTAGTNDTITVYDLLVGDVVKVYADPSTTLPIGTATVASGVTSATISIAQLGTGSGTVYVSVTSGSNDESNRVSKNYAAEPATSSLDAAQILVTNNPASTSDTVTVENLSPGDVVRVYNDPIDPTIIGSGTVATGQNEVTITISQLGTTAGRVYVSISRPGMAESRRTVKSYAAEAKSPSVAVKDITIENRVNAVDIISIRNVQSGDIIKVYPTKNETVALTQATATSDSVMLSTPQLGQAAGTVYVTLTRGTRAESDRVAKSYAAENSSSGVSGTIKVINNSGSADRITISNMNPGDFIRVYSDKTSTTPIAISTANRNLLPKFADWDLHGNARVTSNYQLTLAPTAANQSSSFLVPVIGGLQYTARIESVSSGGTASVQEMRAGSTNGTAVTLSSGVANTWTTNADTTHIRFTLSNSSSPSSITFLNPMLSLGGAVPFEEQASAKTKNLIPSFDRWDSRHANSTVVSDYHLRLFATATNQASSTRVRGVQPNTQYTFSANHNGSVSITAVRPGSTNLVLLSSTAKTFTVTTPSTVDHLIVSFTNNTTGTFNLSNPMLEAGAVATKFEKMLQPRVTGSATVSQLGQAAGKVYVTVTTPGKNESQRYVASYAAEAKSNPPKLSGIKITNNKSGTSDRIVVTGLNAGDVVKVYRTKSTPTVLVSTTVATGSTVATLTYSQLGVEAGSVYISVTSSGKSESNRIFKSYLKE